MKNLKILSVITAAILLLFFSCKKENEPTPYYVKMTDAPGQYEAVYIDLEGVEIKGEGGASVSLNTQQGIYNLLDFSNGMDTLIATGELDFTRVEQIRLILGSDNSVVVDGVSYPLSTPSSQQSGLKLQVHQELQPGVAYYVLLDFDANQSIVETGNGSYSLKPVIRTIDTAISGSIKGKVAPATSNVVVEASINDQVYSSITNAEGNFVVKGLAAGVYTVTITPEFPLLPVTINNVTVDIGVATDIGLVNL